jgi:hypothetical protein
MGFRVSEILSMRIDFCEHFLVESVRVMGEEVSNLKA